RARSADARRADTSPAAAKGGPLSAIGVQNPGDAGVRYRFRDSAREIALSGDSGSVGPPLLLRRSDADEASKAGNLTVSMDFSVILCRILRLSREPAPSFPLRGHTVLTSSPLPARNRFHFEAGMRHLERLS